MQKLGKYASSLVVGALLLSGCSSDSDSTPSTYNYNGPGSDYSLSMSTAGTFELEESTDNLEVSGTWQELDSGFKKLTISTSNKSNPAAGDAAFLLEIPGVISILKPINSDDSQIINMVQAGNCPTENFSSNWIRGDKGFDITQQEVIGDIDYTHSTETAVIDNFFKYDGTDTGQSSNPVQFSCEKGIASVTNGGNTNAKLYLTTNGSAIVRTSGDDSTLGNDDDGFIVGLPEEEIGSKSNLDGTYSGLIFSDNGGGNEEVTPVSLTLESASGTIYRLNDELTASTSTSLGVVDLYDADNITQTDGTTKTASTGFISAQITGSNNGHIQCTANTNVVDTNKKFIFCVGQNPESTTELFTALFISK
jgi:hypothetical protein